MSLRYIASPLVGGDNVVGQGLSETNLVVGATWRKGGLQSSSERAFAWSDSTFTLIDVGPSYNNRAQAVGDDNVIVGIATNANRYGVFSWVENNGIVTVLDGLGGTNSIVSATNGKSHCGEANLPSRVTRCVKWENGSCIDLGTLGGPGAYARAINKQGNVVGSSRVSNSSKVMAAFIYGSGKMIGLPKFDDTHSYAFGINDNDDVVGAAKGGWTPVKWEKAEKPIVLFNGHGQAFDINNNGFAVGSMGPSPSSVAFLHDGKNIINLNDVTEGLNGVSLSVARAINNQGCIIAHGFDSKYNLCGFILIPA